MKEEFEFAVTEILAGMREGCELFVAIIAAPFVVCKDFIQGNGRWALDAHDVRADSAGESDA
jgi:hypothetical protein